MIDTVSSLPVPATYTRILLQWGIFEPAVLLAGTDLCPENLRQNQRISVADQLQVFRNAQRAAGALGDARQGIDATNWAVEFGRQLNTSSHGPLGFAALTAPTLGEGLEVFGQFARIRAPYLGFRTREVGDTFGLELLTDLTPLTDLAEPLVDMVMQIALAYADAVLGAAASQVMVSLARPAPAREAAFRRYFRGQCVFDAGCNALAVPASLRLLPSPLHDEASYFSALARCREALDALLSPQDVVSRATNWLATRFDRMLGDGEPLPAPRLEDMAEALALSPRTLIRRLALHHTSYSALRDAQQHAVACRLLEDARFTVAEIGERLGYGDPANFGRAFRRQSGMSPGQYRRRR